MGDNIRLKGPLGLKQDVYDQARSEEWRKIIKIEDPQIRIKKLEEYFNIEPKKKMKGGVVKKAVFGSLIKNMLSGKELKTEDSAAPYRQTFNVKDSETGETRNIMQNFKPTQSQNDVGNDRGLIGRLFGNIIGNRQSSNIKPLQHDFFVKDQSGQNVNIAEKKDGGLIRQGFPKVAKKGWK